MAKPTDLPEWATSGTVVEPGSGKKATGWVAGELPPAEYFNWLQNLTYEWLAWMDRFSETQEGEWHLANTSPADQAALEISSTAEETTGGASSWKQLITFQAGADRWCGLFSGRLSNSGAFALVMNARWDTATSRWVQTLNTRPSSALICNDTAGNLRLFTEAAGTSPWASWTNRGGIEVGGLDVSGTLLVADVHITNDLQVDVDATIDGTLTTNGVTTANGDINLTGNLVATGSVAGAVEVVSGGDVRAVGDFTYQGSKSRTRVFSGAAFQLDPPAVRSVANGYIIGDPGSSTVTTQVAQIEIPDNATLVSVLVEFDANAAGGVEINVRRMSSTGAAADDCRSGGPVAAGGSGTNQTMTYTCDQNNNANPASAAYEVHIELGAHPGNILKRIEVTTSNNRPKTF